LPIGSNYRTKEITMANKQNAKIRSRLLVEAMERYSDGGTDSLTSWVAEKSPLERPSAVVGPDDHSKNWAAHAAAIALNEPEAA
jgi:hypothetical protein